MATDLDELIQRINGGKIFSASKPELERFAAALSHSQAYTHFADRQFAQVCETVRLLLTIRMSEESNKFANRISLIALGIAILALIVGVVQAVASVWPLL